MQQHQQQVKSSLTQGRAGQRAEERFDGGTTGDRGLLVGGVGEYRRNCRRTRYFDLLVCLTTSPSYEGWNRCGTRRIPSRWRSNTRPERYWPCNSQPAPNGRSVARSLDKMTERSQVALNYLTALTNRSVACVLGTLGERRGGIDRWRFFFVGMLQSRSAGAAEFGVGDGGEGSLSLLR